MIAAATSTILGMDHFSQVDSIYHGTGMLHPVALRGPVDSLWETDPSPPCGLPEIFTACGDAVLGC